MWSHVFFGYLSTILMSLCFWSPRAAQKNINIRLFSCQMRLWVYRLDVGVGHSSSLGSVHSINKCIHTHMQPGESIKTWRVGPERFHMFTLWTEDLFHPNQSRLWKDLTSVFRWASFCLLSSLPWSVFHSALTRQFSFSHFMFFLKPKPNVFPLGGPKLNLDLTKLKLQFTQKHLANQPQRPWFRLTFWLCLTYCFLLSSYFFFLAFVRLYW